MKKFTLILSAVILSLSLTSCADDILNGDPYTSFTKQNYFTSSNKLFTSS